MGLGIILSTWLYRRCPRKNLINEDLDHWKEITKLEGTYTEIFKKLMNERPEYRSLFYYRIGEIRYISKFLRWIMPPMENLYLWTPTIGGGLYIQHGFSTILAAKKIGRHCFVNQQVTVGYKGNFAPEIGDNVTITCGAKVLGNIQVGNNVTIGANAVVVKNVPDNVVVAGIPAKIIKNK